MSRSHRLASASLRRSYQQATDCDEVRREPKSLLIYKKEKAALPDPIGYHEITPWKHEVAINPLSGKIFKGKTKLRV